MVTRSLSSCKSHGLQFTDYRLDLKIVWELPLSGQSYTFHGKLSNAIQRRINDTDFCINDNDHVQISK